MRERRLGRLAIAAVVLWLGQAAVGVQAEVPAHRAAVIVDIGVEVKKVCITFDAETITGTEALELAGLEPVYNEFGGALGSLVCSLCGVGCPAGDCLCGRDTWWYHRAPQGTGTFETSSLGASNTLVGDGDVEGWSWGTGAPPPYADIDTVCGLETVATATTPTATATTTTTSGSATAPTTTAATAAPPTTSAKATAPSSTTAPSATSVVAAEPGPPTSGVAAGPDGGDEGSGGGSLASLGLLAGLVAGTLTLGRWLRRRRVSSKEVLDS